MPKRPIDLPPLDPEEDRRQREIDREDDEHERCAACDRPIRGEAVMSRWGKVHLHCAEIP